VDEQRRLSTDCILSFQLLYSLYTEYDHIPGRLDSHTRPDLSRSPRPIDFGVDTPSCQTIKIQRTNKMPATLYLRPQPRAFFLLTTTHALIFRQPDATETKASRTVVVAEFLPIDEVDVRGLVRASRTRTVDGVLGVTSVPTGQSLHNV